MKDKRFLDAMRVFLVVCAIVLVAFHVPACVRYVQSAKLIVAIGNDRVDTVRTMLESGVTPNMPDGPYRGLWKYINGFVEHAPRCPLSIACEKGNLEMVKLLLDYGADPAFTEQEGFNWSALSSAILYSKNEHSLEIVVLLLENGADVESDKDGWPPFELACMEYISPENTTEERNAHAERVVEIAKLVKGNYDLNPLGTITPLMQAALNNNHLLVEYLLSIGADPNIQLSDGRTAYDFANNAGYEEVAAILKNIMKANGSE